MKLKTLDKIIEKSKDILEVIPAPIKISVLSFALGAGLGKLGKSTNQHLIPAVPVAMDILWGTGINPYYIPYAVGVAINHLPEIYQTFTNL